MARFPLHGKMELGRIGRSAGVRQPAQDRPAPSDARGADKAVCGGRGYFLMKSATIRLQQGFFLRSMPKRSSPQLKEYSW